MTEKNKKDQMHGIEPKKNSKGEIISYKFRCCVGRDEQYRQVWRTCTISANDPRLEGLTPKKLRDKLISIKYEWNEAQKDDYNRTHSKIDKSKITFEEFVNTVWFPDHVMNGRHSPNSIEFYKYLSADIVSYFGNKKLKDIDAEKIKRYIKYLNTEAKTKKGEPLSNVTIIRHYQTLRNIINYALRFDYIKDDPGKKLSVDDKPQKERKEIDFLAPKEAQKYIQALESQPIYWRCLENILITCGLRRGEVAGLKYGDINKEKLTLEICRSVTYDRNGENKLRISGTKTGKNRTVSITPRILSMIQALKKDQEEKYGMTLTDESYLFCNLTDPSRPLMPTDITRWQRKFVERNRLPDVSPHDLRHSAASLALEAGANLKDVQELLGHQDPETTSRFYAGLTEEAKRRTVTGIENLLVPQTEEKKAK